MKELERAFKKRDAVVSFFLRRGTRLKRTIKRQDVARGLANFLNTFELPKDDKLDEAPRRYRDASFSGAAD